ncbi:hypothetical protein CVCC1112_656 [Paenarthrobacter nicotinovorans]|nr:hypothetical protein CVCC1112_656 [Paenarthrobacter nicotinovorans]
MPCLNGSGGGHGGVHSAAHCCKYSHAGFLDQGMWRPVRLLTAVDAHPF